MTVADRLMAAITAAPGRTEAELARELFGEQGQPSRINFACRLLEVRDRVQRLGAGGPGDPYRYHPTVRETAAVSPR